MSLKLRNIEIYEGIKLWNKVELVWRMINIEEDDKLFDEVKKCKKKKNVFIV